MTKDILMKYKTRLEYSNNHNFIRNVEPDFFFDNAIFEPTLNAINGEFCSIEKIVYNEIEHHFVLKKQVWESEYFGFPCFSIEFIFFDHLNYLILRNAINLFIKYKIPLNSYCKINVTSEDTILVLALGSTKFNLVETRLNYVLKINNSIESNNLNIISRATNIDIDPLRLVAKKMRNNFSLSHFF